MWGPCRDVALQRQADERLAGYDARTLRVATALTYKDCIAADRRQRPHSVYDLSGQAAGAISSGRGDPSALLVKPQD